MKKYNLKYLINNKNNTFNIKKNNIFRETYKYNLILRCKNFNYNSFVKQLNSSNNFAYYCNDPPYKK